ncbi:hypothetical protein SSIG_02776 [Streptomyces filamentosus NRRL 11379]|uniref:Uncharacterized protein n=1 Tax=Streptomyces filamentosus NRRL 15998 TaxID=457431 RepID=D6AKG7_STRFL|nr:conserved hypothetical protein [Streptomyces filamentosus NRRL 15998]EWS92273.1 hypothetical protein SSIG_02776 [Streptomyces filamentosus NRRL 11379]
MFDQGRDAFLSGDVPRQEPPLEGGGRWGLTVALRPESSVARRMERVTAEAMAVAGGSHWPTGAEVSSHVTVRTLERYRPAVAEDDEQVLRYRAALRRASARVGTIRLELTGLTLTPASVMLCASPSDDAIERFAGYLAEELTSDGWFEAGFTRDIWYANLVHFTGLPENPQALVEWVAARRSLDLGASVHTFADLVSWTFTGRHMVPATLGSERLRGSAG